jgi:hypothetical protein
MENPAKEIKGVTRILNIFMKPFINRNIFSPLSKNIKLTNEKVIHFIAGIDKTGGGTTVRMRLLGTALAKNGAYSGKSKINMYRRRRS